MPPTASGIRARNRAAIEQEILVVAGRHLARDGAAALSLRAVARELGMASSAVYRYVESRDELLTLLIVEAFDSLGDAVDRAVDGVTDPAERFRVIGRSLRLWSAAHPHQFALVYGSPVPGYHAPAERTNPAGTRVTDQLLDLILRLHPRRRHTDDPRAAAALAGMLGEPPIAGAGVPPELVARGVAAWTLVVGSVTAERFEQFGTEAITDPDQHFEVMLDLALGLVLKP